MLYFVDIFFAIVECDPAKNYMFLEIHNCKWLDCNMAKWPRIVCFYIFLTGERLNNLLPDNIKGIIILKQKCTCGSSFVKIIWNPLTLKMSATLRVRSSGSTFCKSPENKGMQKLRRICCSDSFLFLHSLLFSVSTISLAASIMLSIYDKLSSHALAIWERASQ